MNIMHYLRINMHQPPLAASRGKLPRRPLPIGNARAASPNPSSASASASASPGPAQDKPGASPGPAQDKPGASPVLVALDSLIPDSLIPGS
jgi:hypothetical protein